MSINIDSMHINSDLYKKDEVPVKCTCRRREFCDHQGLYEDIYIPVSEEEVTQLKSKGQDLYCKIDGQFFLHTGISSSSQTRQSLLPAQETAEKVENCTGKRWCDCSGCSGM